MTKDMDKHDYKKYLISETALLLGGFVLFFATLHFLAASGRANVSLTAAQTVWLALALALVPTGNYAGVVFFGTKIKELKNKQAVLLVVLLPLLLVLVTVAGIALILPTAVHAVISLLRK